MYKSRGKCVGVCVCLCGGGGGGGGGGVCVLVINVNWCVNIEDGRYSYRWKLK